MGKLEDFVISEGFLFKAFLVIMMVGGGICWLWMVFYIMPVLENKISEKYIERFEKIEARISETEEHISNFRRGYRL